MIVVVKHLFWKVNEKNGKKYILTKKKDLFTCFVLMKFLTTKQNTNLVERLMLKEIMQ